MNKWRPIKTAPKDCLILLAEPPTNPIEYPWVVRQGRWVDVPHLNEVHKSYVEHKPIPENIEGHWIAEYTRILVSHRPTKEQYCYEGYPLVMYPTHWMPLPNPPKRIRKKV